MSESKPPDLIWFDMGDFLADIKEAEQVGVLCTLKKEHDDDVEYVRQDPEKAKELDRKLKELVAAANRALAARVLGHVRYSEGGVAYIPDTLAARALIAELEEMLK